MPTTLGDTIRAIDECRCNFKVVFYLFRVQKRESWILIMGTRLFVYRYCTINVDLVYFYFFLFLLYTSVCTQPVLQSMRTSQIDFWNNVFHYLYFCKMYSYIFFLNTFFVSWKCKLLTRVTTPFLPRYLSFSISCLFAFSSGICILKYFTGYIYPFLLLRQACAHNCVWHLNRFLGVLRLLRPTAQQRSRSRADRRGLKPFFKPIRHETHANIHFLFSLPHSLHRARRTWLEPYRECDRQVRPNHHEVRGDNAGDQPTSRLSEVPDHRRVQG